ncbi:transcription initiation factor TFIID component TAF4 family-domain-containing protein [Amylocystis lapponica]|nr:transcription initiation factor TFIID component TAF4 family-domain-containing protein [Amylocystis lapponica]
MKTEHDTPQPTPTTFSTAQWNTNREVVIPVQQTQQQTTAYSHYQPYQHYPQATYGHYQYAPQQTAPAPQPQAAPATSRQNTQSNAMDTTDVATLNDALGSAGVDLRAEEESLQRSYDQYQSFRPYEDRTRKQAATPNFDVRFLGATMRTIGNQHKVTRVPEDAVNYLALALRARLQDLVTAMIAASEHRMDTQFDRPASLYEDGSPMWGIAIRSDVGKQLAALEKVEREEEMRVRRERKERLEAVAAQSVAMSQSGSNMSVDGAGYDEEGGPKKKKKKEGPGVTARNMSEDVRKKMSNAVASQAAGLGTGKYAWMTAAATPAKPNLSLVGPPYVPTKPSQQQAAQKEEDTRRSVNLRDAMFVIEKERGHGGGRGSARGWT